MAGAQAVAIAEPAKRVQVAVRSPRILSTLYWPKRASWMSRVDVVNRTELSTAAVLRRLVASRGRYDAVVLDGATGGAVRLTDLGAAMLLARRARGPAVVITDATWGEGVGLLDRAGCRMGLRAFDSPRVTYCVLSSDEARLFPRTWGIPAQRVAFTPFYFTLTDEDLALRTSTEGGVFAGGDSLRDYGPLIEAARGLDVPVTLATRSVNLSQLPSNVRAGWLTRDAYVEAMCNAAVVVVALAPTRERSAGQQNYLNAMALGKLVVVPDVLGVRDYVEHGRTGILVPPGDAHALRAVLRWALDPSRRAKVRDIGGRAREVVRARFGPDQYVANVLAVVEKAVTATPSSCDSAAPPSGRMDDRHLALCPSPHEPASLELAPSVRHSGAHGKRGAYQSTSTLTPTDAAASRICSHVARSTRIPFALRCARAMFSGSPATSTGSAGSTGGDAFT